jgi:hypothetical protein
MVHCFERFQQSAKVSRKELLPKGRIVARLRKFALGNQLIHGLGL